MNETEAHQFISDHSEVTPQMIMVAKAFLVRNHQEETLGMLTEFLKAQSASMPSQIILHPSHDPVPELTSTAHSIAWRLAACESIWALIHATVFVPLNWAMVGDIPVINLTTVVDRNSGGSTWGFHSITSRSLPVPGRTRVAPSCSHRAPRLLSDGDLFVENLNIRDIHAEVDEAIRDAVRCFRYELYTPSLAVLSKAAEGAWIEMGLSLAKALQKSLAPTPSSLSAKTEKYLKDPCRSFADKIDDIVKIYEHHEMPTSIRQHNGVELDLNEQILWTTELRKSRNAVHYGTLAPMPNTYEKVSALFMAATVSFQRIYEVRRAAENSLVNQLT